MKRDDLIDKLAQAQRRVTEGRELIQNQRELLADLYRNQEADLVPEALAVMEALLEAHASNEQILREVQDELRSC